MNEQEEDPKRILLKNLNLLNVKMLNSGFTMKELHNITQLRRNSVANNDRNAANNRRNNIPGPGLSMFLYSFLILIMLFVLTPVLYSFLEFLLAIKCFFPNNYIIYEATRPLADCRYCKNLRKPIILKNVSSDNILQEYIYSSQPIVIKGAVKEWPAYKLLNYSYIKKLYIEKYPEALDEDYQFLNFRSDLLSLKDVFRLSQARIDNKEEQPWFVGLEVRHPGILAELRKIYPSPPQFLPADSEMPDKDFIFMGYDQGAIMHLDYISRLMWQAQIKGNKTWILSPTPECDYECSSLSFYVEAGDAILLDTRLWYYGIYVARGQFSITIQSEYG